ncbi:glycosyltransferase [Pasteurellaceae bacterium 20609_3]|uniref:glycosyltransferase n=1 Tax=Spirabiliibacterium mucosae TaxID=28156 RepID=UPI001AAD25ED|nr:glycosyltransferase [Spirabiliibacterium mucosae]MBE2898702.1 glycosyltransferase [Spirabiliibacterium mucosae]
MVFNPADHVNVPKISFAQWNKRKPVFQWLTPKIDGKKFIKLSQDESQQLSREPITHTISCGDGVVELVLSIDIFSNQPKPKQALLFFSFRDKDGRILDPVVDYPFSKALNKSYVYLNTDPRQFDQVLLILPETCRSVDIGLQTWDSGDAKIQLSNKVGITTYKEGVSVVIPTYKGVNTIRKCIESLLNQDFPKDSYELLIAINGESDGTNILLEKIKRKHPLANIRILQIQEAGVANARNLAVSESSYNYTTFIDDDDYVSQSYLTSLYSLADYYSVVLTGVTDVSPEGKTLPTVITQQLGKVLLKEDIQYSDVSSSLTMNACKLAPAHMVKAVSYLCELRSGEDVVYWSELISRFQPRVKVVEELENAVYYRVLRENSVSRQKESFDFNVRQRLMVISELIRLLKNAPVKIIADFVQSKINAQAGFVKRYLSKYPQEFPDFQLLVDELKVNNSVIREINAQFSTALIISYCYAPYIDTSGVVMGKRVRNMEQTVDVIYNSMDKVRSKDANLLNISLPFVGKMIELKCAQTFSNWNGIEQFAEQAFVETARLLSRRPIYEKIYSRAMWPASHFAAALIKI